MAQKKKRAAAVSPRPVPPPPPDVPEPDPGPARPARGLTTDQIRRISTRIEEHERDLKGSTSRR